MNYYASPEFELYRINEDPWEMNNLIDKPEEQAIANVLKAKLKKWMVEQGDDVKNTQTPRLLSMASSWQTVITGEKSLVN